MKEKSKTLFKLLMAFALIGCDNPVEQSSEAVESFQIKVIDLDGKEVGNKTIQIEDELTVFSALVDNFEVDYTNGEYGAYITSINGSVVDSNYYMAIYENEEMASTGIEGLSIDCNDVFTFKVECWNTVESGYGVLDEYDLLVDKVVYGYYKDLDLSSIETYADSSFWDLLAINLAKNNFYDSNVFSYDSISSIVKEEIDKVDITTLNGNGFIKYAAYARALGLDMSALSLQMESYVATLSNEYSPYVTPFVMSASKMLNVESETLNSLSKVEISSDLTWGPDASVWQCATSLLYNDQISKDVLKQYVETIDYGNSSSNALVLQAFAAFNENIRSEEYKVDGKDLIEVLFDNYYDSETNTIQYTKGEENTFSYNQVMASLLAYKVCRDTMKAANIYE